MKKPRETVTVDFEQFLKTFKPAYHDSWEVWFEEAYKTQPQRIKELEEEYVNYGGFEEPVQVMLEPYDEEDEEFTPSLTNGMHRTAVLFKNKANTITYSVDRSNEEHKNKVYPKTSYMLLASITNNTSVDSFDLLHDFYSWRHKGSRVTPWLTVECGTDSSLYIHCDEKMILELSLEELYEELQSRWGVFGVTIDGVYITKWVDKNQEEYIETVEKIYPEDWRPTGEL